VTRHGLIAAPFRSGLHEAFAIVVCLVAAAASLLRGGRRRQPVEAWEPSVAS
jgi:hypothetical protein